MTPGPDSPSAGALNVIGALMEQRTGQLLAANRAWRIETALLPLLRERAIPGFDALIGALVSGADRRLPEAVVEALLNQETSFYRDAGVLEQVVEAASAMQRDSNHPVRILSAGCSTGQEPLSLAMLFAERDEGIEPEIQASDISRSAISRARRGAYTQFEVQRGLPIRRLMNWFDQTGGDWVAKPELVGTIQYRCHNLAKDPILHGRFDIILCRNVLLYFAPNVRRQVLDTLAAGLKPGGLLVLGAGETVIGQSERLSPCRQWRGFYELTAMNAERSTM